MNRLRRKSKGITFKTSLFTSGLLIGSTVVIFILFYFLLPGYYHQYKIKTLNEALDELIRLSEHETFHEAQRQLDLFTQEHNVWMGVQDENGRLVYVPSVFVRHDEAASEDAQGMQNMPLRKIQLDTPIENMYAVSKPISFQDARYTLMVNATLQPIDEASRAILLFAPDVLLLVLLVSIAGAAVYSRWLTRPLLNMNRAAKSMANLDFTGALQIHSEDEIGELSRSLNRLSQNLQDAMEGLRQANAQLNTEIHKVRQLEEKRKEWIATISHELKTPITTVTGQLEGMIHRIGAFQDRDKYLHRSHEVMMDMQKLVQELLDSSRMESSDFRPEWETVDLSDVVRDSLRRLDYMAADKRITIVSETAGSPKIRADRNLLQKAVTNVIRNAIQYSPAGEQVKIRTESDPRHVMLQVWNAGTAIAEDQLEEIFQPFHRIERSRNRGTGGSGLGLYIVKQILEAHRASYAVTNADGGILFTIRFPREDL
ncbi:HAMP domain-containing histidine kinase [Paenibacillus doosanensis]|uniref:histidine kinase n=1 Tax=Paenibacillus konkukensis TaxID=2020716 RepID=A0ABY4RGJ6_9BACL|nr:MULTISPECIES: HAMP domain-containing sensor histidine kinase [Paenibacillus]MCS7460508.1 HAMP domain-containing histidine kinase [Paenibacillus doosanensis]UQZ81270.1 Alkaline phosphatase synthesis sensor protein PhoR [Paenibacillus konkukensis]